MMQTTFVALLSSSTLVDAFASQITGDVYPPPSPPPSPPMWEADARTIDEWQSHPNACSTPPFWDVTWETYDNTQPSCRFNTQQNQGRPFSRFDLLNANALFPHDILSKGNPAGYVELEKEYKNDIIENHILQHFAWNANPASPYGKNPTLPIILDEDETDGFIIMHQGKVAYEKYYNRSKFSKAIQTNYSRHRQFSNTKSFVGLMTQMLINEGRLHETEKITDILPAMKGSGFEGATVANALNMRVAIAYDEYGESCDNVTWQNEFDKFFASTGPYSYPVVPGCEVAQMMQVSGLTQMHPLSWKYNTGVDAAGFGTGLPYNPGPQNLREFLPLLKEDASRTHGSWTSEMVNYQSIITDVLAWIIDTKLKGHDPGSAQEYFEKNLWSKVGQGADATLLMGYAQIPSWQGGLSATLQDMARFGEMLREGGVNKRGEEVVPAAVIEALMHPPEKFLPVSPDPSGCHMGYKDQFWISRARAVPGAQAGQEFEKKTWFGMNGIWGQFVWIFPHLNMTVAKHATKKDLNHQCWHALAYQEVGVLLGQKAGSG